VSDLHGNLQALDDLLRAAGLAAGGRWTGRRQLLVVAGDLIDGGPDSAGVVLRLRDLQALAAAAGSRVVVLLGNHEVDFLDKPRRASKELLASAARAGLDLGRKNPGKRLAETGFGTYLRSLPVAAVIGTWLFAHAGFIDAGDDDASLRGWFAALTAGWEQENRYDRLREAHSIVEYHNWWKAGWRRKLMRAHLRRLGLDVLAFGHDPDALGAMGTIAVSSGGYLVKLDTGIKAGGSRGMLLRCDVPALPDACRAVSADGTQRAIPVR